MALQAPENISINQKGSQLDISPSTCLCHSNRARSLSWIFWTLLSSSRKEAGPHYSPGSEKELDSFISKARLGDILSYVPDITKPGQRTNLTKIFDTILVRIGRKDYCCSWSWPGIAKQKKVVRELLLSRRLCHT